MKRAVSVIIISLLSFTLVISQEIDKIFIKGDFLKIDMKCKTAYRNLQASGRSYVEVDKVVIRRKAILSIVVKKNKVIITTSELSLGYDANVSKHYRFKFSDSIMADKFYLNLIENITN